MFDFSNVSGMLFDCDGTLIDSLGIWEVAEQALFDAAGPIDKETENRLHAAPIDEAAQVFHDELGVFESADAVLAHLDSYLLPFYGEQCNEIFGASTFVRAAYDAGVPLAVVSSSPRRYLEAGLARLGIDACFKALVTTDEVRLSKLDARMYDAAVCALGSEPATTWLIDDAPFALKAAREAGLHTIGFAAGADRARLEAVRASSDIVCADLSTLLED